MKWFVERKYVMILVFFCCLLWGSAFPSLKIAYSALALKASDYNLRILFAGLRFMLAALMLLFFTKFVLKMSLKINRNELFKLSGLGVINTSLLYYFFYNGLANTSGIKAAILQSSSSFMVVILSHFIYTNDKLSLGKARGIIFGFMGIIIVNINQGFGGLNFSFSGDGFMIFAGMAGAVGTILAKNIGTKIHPFKMTAWQMFIGSSLLLLYGISKTSVSELHLTMPVVGILIYLSFVSATAFGLWFTLLKYNKAGEIAIYRFMIPIAGSLLTALFIPGENFSFNIILGLASVSLGIYFVNKVPAAKIQSNET